MLKAMLQAARKASESCDTSFDLAKLLLSYMQAHWGSGWLGWSAKRDHQGIMLSQERAGPKQVLLGRLSKLWSAAHGRELDATSVAKHRFNDGPAWVRRICSVAWDHIHLMWLERSQGRHGREPKERTERARQRSLREIAMWHKCKERGLLDATEAEKPLFYCGYRAHLKAESSARDVGMWLSTCTCRPVLVLREARAREQRMAKRKHGKSSGDEGTDEGHSSADFVGDGEPAEPMLVDPDAGLRGIIGSIPLVASSAMLAARRWRCSLTWCHLLGKCTYQ